MEQAANPEIDARREMNQHDYTIDDAARKMETGPGKKIMDGLRVKLQEIIDAEEVLIGVRSEEQESTSTFAISFTLIGTIIAIVIGSAVAFFITRGILVPLNATNGTVSPSTPAMKSATSGLTSTPLSRNYEASLTRLPALPHNWPPQQKRWLRSPSRPVQVYPTRSRRPRWSPLPSLR
jgi:hypothetical protein